MLLSALVYCFKTCFFRKKPLFQMIVYLYTTASLGCTDLLCSVRPIIGLPDGMPNSILVNYLPASLEMQNGS